MMNNKSRQERTRAYYTTIHTNEKKRRSVNRCPWHPVDLSRLSANHALLAAIPGAIFAAQIFVESNLASLLTASPDHRLVKGAGHHLDFLCVGILTAACSVFGAPWVMGRRDVKSLVRLRVALLIRSSRSSHVFIPFFFPSDIISLFIASFSLTYQYGLATIQTWIISSLQSDTTVAVKLR